MLFEWDVRKADTNARRHAVGFAEAATVFTDPLSVTVSDPDHSEDEDRFITIGTSASRRLLIVAHTDRADRIRIISARRATQRERTAYESGDFERDE